MRHVYQILTELLVGKSQLSAVYNLRIKKAMSKLDDRGLPWWRSG